MSNLLSRARSERPYRGSTRPRARRWPAALLVAWLLAVGTLMMGCDTTKCTGLKTFQVVENHHGGIPWASTTYHGRCDGWDFCVMEGDGPACVPWWSALGRSPWFLGTLALATVIVTVRVARKRQRQILEKTPPIDNWRPPPTP